jgi:hypothetical protein
MEPELLTLTPQCLLQMMQGLTSYVVATNKNRAMDAEGTAAEEAA